MNCETASGLLPELLAGALGREVEAELLRHLASCAQCRGDLAFWAQVAGAAEAEAGGDPGEWVDDVRARLFGPRAATLGESLRAVGRALGLAESVCRLAMSAVGRP